MTAAKADEPHPVPATGPATVLAGALLAFATLGPALGAAMLTPLAVANHVWLSTHADALLSSIFIGVVLLCGVALLPTFVATVLLCWLYGPAVGLLLTLASTTAAALLGRLLAGLLGQRTIVPLVQARPRLRAVRDVLLGDAFWRSARTVAMLRVSPIVPFAVVNALSGLAGTRLDAFLVGSAAGMLPRATLVATWTATLPTLTFDRPADLGWLIGGVIVTLAVLLLLGRSARAALRQASSEAADLTNPRVATT